MFQPRNYTKGDDNNPMLVGKEKEMYESKNWPKSFSTPVDITKVRIEAFKPWITKRVSELMGIEDDILVDYCMSQLKELGEYDAKRNSQLAGDGGSAFNEKPRLDPKRLQISLTGFMAKKASTFVRELWDLLLSAQSSEHGIPQKFIDEKKKELEDRSPDDSHHRERSSRVRSKSHSSADSRHRDEHGRHRVSRHSEKHRKEHYRSREKTRDSSEHRSPKREDRDRHEKSENHKNRKRRETRRRSSSSSYSRERSRDRHRRRRRQSSRSSSNDRYRRRRDRSSSEDSGSSDRRERRRVHRSRKMSRREYSSTSSSLSPGKKFP